jgi:hypothetical protein
LKRELGIQTPLLSDPGATNRKELSHSTGMDRTRPVSRVAIGITGRSDTIVASEVALQGNLCDSAYPIHQPIGFF